MVVYPGLGVVGRAPVVVVEAAGGWGGAAVSRPHLPHHVGDRRGAKHAPNPRSVGDGVFPRYNPPCSTNTHSLPPSQLHTPPSRPLRHRHCVAVLCSADLVTTPLTDTSNVTMSSPTRTTPTQSRYTTRDLCLKSLSDSQSNFLRKRTKCLRNTFHCVTTYFPSYHETSRTCMRICT